MKKILIYGGAFNPPHIGHERILKSALEALEPDLALVIPSAVSPHKTNARVALELRALMCRSFEKLSDVVRVSLIERAGAHDKSYTLKTLRRIKKKYPESELYLLIGSDMLLSFEEWHRFRRILSMAVLLAATRTGDDLELLRAKAYRLERLGGSVMLLDYEPFPVSSSEIRRAIGNAKDTSELLDEQTEKIIGANRLYSQPETKQ